MFDNNYQDQQAQNNQTDPGMPTSLPTPGPFDGVAAAHPAPTFTPMPPAPEDTAAPAAAPAEPMAPPAPADSSASAPNDLLSIKQEALQHLSPLVGHLEQSPEEKFRTTMMMIQASDDQSLVKAAYEAAQAIPDEKVRAQALLDVVNEINYFTQQTHHDQ